MQPKCNKTTISSSERAEIKLNFVFLKCQKSWTVIARLLGKQSIPNSSVLFVTKGAQAQQQPRCLGREKAANPAFSNMSSALAEWAVRAALMQIQIKNLKGIQRLMGFLQSPSFQGKDRLKLVLGWWWCHVSCQTRLQHLSFFMPAFFMQTFFFHFLLTCWKRKTKQKLTTKQ